MAEDKPLFETNVPCPHCGYNLRGLLEARCPECGKPFIRQHVLRSLQQRRHAPPLLWVIRNVHRRPMAFWLDVAAPEEPEDPLRIAMFPAAGVGAAMAVVVVGAVLDCVLAGTLRVDAVPPVMFAFTLVAGVMLVAAVVLLAVHRVLVSLVLLGRSSQPWTDAWFVGYPAACLATALPVATAGLWSSTEVEMGGPWGTLPISRPVCLLCALGLLVLLLLWSLSLYEGGRRMSHGSHARGVLCALVNPFLWLLGHAAIAVAAIVLQ